MRYSIPTILFLTFAALAGGGCELVTGGATEHVIHVDSISVPDSIAPSESFDIQFYGMIGSDSCSRLERVDRSVDESGIRLKFIAERRRGDCKQMPVMLDHQEHVSPPLQFPFTITVDQPSGAPLVSEVHLKAADAAGS